VLLHILVVGHTVFDHRAGDEVLQLVLVTFVKGFELIVDVYDKVLTDIGECVLLLRIYLASIVVTFKSRRTKQIEKGGLEFPLFSCQYKTSMVTALTVVYSVGNYCNKPFDKVWQPLFRVEDENAPAKI